MERSEDRRRHPRFPLLLKATARALAAQGTARTSQRATRCRISNLSEGGLCLLSDQPLPASALVECRLQLPSLPVPITCLLNVRWARRRENGRKHEAGLQFLA